MKVAGGLRHARPYTSPSADERAHSSARISRIHLDGGDYEAAREAMRGLWPRSGEPPLLEGLSAAARAAVLLQVGLLAAFEACERAPEGSQETAKSYMREALSLFEELRDLRGAAETRIELARCLRREGSFDEAHAQLDGAQAALAKLGDELRAAPLHEMRARLFIDEGHLPEAESAARAAISILERAGRAEPYSEAMLTLGTLLARSGRLEEAGEILLRAAEAAEASGEREAAGLAALALAEELGEELSTSEFAELYERAAELLAPSRRADVRERLSECALRFIKARASSLGVAPEPNGDEGADEAKDDDWEGFSLKREVLRYEAELIERALREAEGSVSRAAKLLGFKHHQTFVALLNNRHRELLHVRNPIVHRRAKSQRSRTQKA